ncbi:hypothetical protein [Cytobacillus purgationiresistens]|uniref:Uncharacterized protein n=1 Tax=Cytobacillus purgationiresistens TaxID=863449 RepID=A0ABU0AF78_9BACI|nr:hypothetical protein [Cytobacillus purgationiresistens]MDQ0269905.1 hypothetical protein [Cytobacillus purgationiresistens]
MGKIREQLKKVLPLIMWKDTYPTSIPIRQFAWLKAIQFITPDISLISLN